MDYAERLERKFVELVLQLATKQGLNKAEVARRAFPDRRQPGRKLHQIEKRSKLGIPQKLSLRDAHFLAHSIGQDLHSVLFAAVESIRAGESLSGLGGGSSNLNRM